MRTASVLAVPREPFAATTAKWFARQPASVWIALQALALWPTWRWILERVSDGSDEPLGVLALGAVLTLLWRDRALLSQTPHAGWFTVATVGMALTLLARGSLPPLFVGVIAVLSLGANVAAFSRSDQQTSTKARPLIPIVGLLLLSLPVISSLQFYAGFPLRVIAAEAGKFLLMWMGYTAERTGSAMTVDGQLIIVDAPCSGVQMLWFGYFTACAVAALYRIDSRAFCLRLPFVGVLVLLGNIVRNVALMTLQVEVPVQPVWWHDATGLTSLACVCLSIGVVMRGARRHA